MFHKLTIALAVAAVSAFAQDVPEIVVVDAQDESESVPQMIAVDGKPQCQRMDFKAHAGDFSGLNALIDAGNMMFKSVLDKFDPFTITDKQLSTIPFKPLLSEFQITPTIKSMKVAGVSNVNVHHIDNIEANKLSFGLQFNGELHLSGSVDLHIEQVNRRWSNICWTDIWKPSVCKPLNATLEFDFGVVNPSADVVVMADMLECPSGSDPEVCKDLTPNDLMNAALFRQFDALLKRILLRVHDANIQQITAKFDTITAANAHFTSDGELLRSIESAISKFSIGSLNKHEFAYNTFMKFVQDVSKSLSNKAIKEFLAPHFGNNCYEE